jgi:hypothetical protein
METQYNLQILADKGKVAQALRAIADEIEAYGEEDLDDYYSETSYYDVQIFED